MDEEVNPLERDHSLSVVLPGGMEKNATVHGSKPVMDLLVMLCASYHLNPSDYTVEVLSPNKNNISFKPNSPIGSLEAEKIVLKPRGVEEKIRRPYMPEATVRLLINYNKSHKAVVRVNPRAPLELLMPAICDKCEFKAETTVLLKDCQSQEPLDLTKSLNDHGLREVFARDTAAVTPTEVISPPPLQDLVQDTNLPRKERKQKENKGFLSLFRRKKKNPEMDGSQSSPDSPGLNKELAASTNSLGVYCSNTPPADMPKKRPAPQPPMGVSQSMPNNLSTLHLSGPQSSTDSTLRRTKRRAPPPPCANAHPAAPADTEVEGTVNSLHTVEELRESEESDYVNLSPSSSSSQPHPRSSPSPPSVAHLDEVSNPYLPTEGCEGKELSHACSALAKILTTSLSSGTHVQHLKNSATFPRLHNGSSFMSMTQKNADHGDLHAELESVLKSTPSAEPEWEDPAQRKGLTTFKVVPLKKQSSFEVELNLEVPDQSQISADDNTVSEASAEAKNNQTETQEDPSSPETSETEIPQPESELCPGEAQSSSSQLSPLPPPLPDSENESCPSSPPAEAEENLEKSKEEDVPAVKLESPQTEPLDHRDEELTRDDNFSSELECETIKSPVDQSLCEEVDQPRSETDERAAEEEGVEEEEEDSFPPPPPPVFFCEELEGMEEAREDPVSSSLLSPEPSRSISNGQGETFSTGHLDAPTSAMPYRSPISPKSLKMIGTAPSRFAQAVALAVQKSRVQSQGKSLGQRISHGLPSTLPTPTSPHTKTVPDWLPHTFVNGSSCLG
ncbi:cordon-bleu protein-like 1 [Myripristis murdjan]|uniref:cordon-bleu protein-like 1 n=1 Tax=Myripristis murdjan TaxID=586833 RepID=UPI001175D830|nr:cordon-bleu protein-like 1 [Myripristis murdjan]